MSHEGNHMTGNQNHNQIMFHCYTDSCHKNRPLKYENGDVKNCQFRNIRTYLKTYIQSNSKM